MAKVTVHRPATSAPAVLTQGKCAYNGNGNHEHDRVALRTGDSLLAFTICGDSGHLRIHEIVRRGQKTSGPSVKEIAPLLSAFHKEVLSNSKIRTVSTNAVNPHVGRFMKNRGAEGGELNYNPETGKKEWTGEMRLSADLIRNHKGLKEEMNEDIVTCKGCGRGVHTDDGRCIHCGKQIPQNVNSAAVSEARLIDQPKGAPKVDRVLKTDECDCAGPSTHEEPHGCYRIEHGPYYADISTCPRVNDTHVGYLGTVPGEQPSVKHFTQILKHIKHVAHKNSEGIIRAQFVNKDLKGFIGRHTDNVQGSPWGDTFITTEGLLSEAELTKTKATPCATSSRSGDTNYYFQHGTVQAVVKHCPHEKRSIISLFANGLRGQLGAQQSEPHPKDVMGMMRHIQQWHYENKSDFYAVAGHHKMAGILQRAGATQVSTPDWYERRADVAHPLDLSKPEYQPWHVPYSVTKEKVEKKKNTTESIVEEEGIKVKKTSKRVGWCVMHDNDCDGDTEHHFDTGKSNASIIYCPKRNHTYVDWMGVNGAESMNDDDGPPTPQPSHTRAILRTIAKHIHSKKGSYSAFVINDSVRKLMHGKLGATYDNENGDSVASYDKFKQVVKENREFFLEGIELLAEARKVDPLGVVTRKEYRVPVGKRQHCNEDDKPENMQTIPCKDFGCGGSIYKCEPCYNKKYGYGTASKVFKDPNCNKDKCDEHGCKGTDMYCHSCEEAGCDGPGDPTFDGHLTCHPYCYDYDCKGPASSCHPHCSDYGCDGPEDECDETCYSNECDGPLKNCKECTEEGFKGQIDNQTCIECGHDKGSHTDKSGCGKKGGCECTKTYSDVHNQKVEPTPDYTNQPNLFPGVGPKPVPIKANPTHKHCTEGNPEHCEAADHSHYCDEPKDHCEQAEHNHCYNSEDHCVESEHKHCEHPSVHCKELGHTHCENGEGHDCTNDKCLEHGSHPDPIIKKEKEQFDQGKEKCPTDGKHCELGTHTKRNEGHSHRRIVLSNGAGKVNIDYCPITGDGSISSIRKHRADTCPDCGHADANHSATQGGCEELCPCSNTLKMAQKRRAEVGQPKTIHTINLAASIHGELLRNNSIKSIDVSRVRGEVTRSPYSAKHDKKVGYFAKKLTSVLGKNPTTAKIPMEVYRQTMSGALKRKEAKVSFSNPRHVNHSDTCACGADWDTGKESVYHMKGEDTPTVYHGSKGVVSKVNRDLLQTGDAGWYGKGFYTTPDKAYAQGYSNGNMNEFVFRPEAKILKVHSDFDKTHEDVRKAVVKHVGAHREELHYGADVSDGEIESTLRNASSRPNSRWTKAVDHFAEKHKYDAVHWGREGALSDGGRAPEVVVKNLGSIASRKKMRKIKGILKAKKKAAAVSESALTSYVSSLNEAEKKEGYSPLVIGKKVAYVHHLMRTKFSSKELASALPKIEDQAQLYKSYIKHIKHLEKTDPKRLKVSKKFVTKSKFFVESQNLTEWNCSCHTGKPSSAGGFDKFYSKDFVEDPAHPYNEKEHLKHLLHHCIERAAERYSVGGKPLDFNKNDYVDAVNKIRKFNAVVTARKGPLETLPKGTTHEDHPDVIFARHKDKHANENVAQYLVRHTRSGLWLPVSYHTKSRKVLTILHSRNLEKWNAPKETNEEYMVEGYLDADYSKDPSLKPDTYTNKLHTGDEDHVIINDRCKAKLTYKKKENTVFVHWLGLMDDKGKSYEAGTTPPDHRTKHVAAVLQSVIDLAHSKKAGISAHAVNTHAKRFIVGALGGTNDPVHVDHVSTSYEELAKRTKRQDDRNNTQSL